MTVYEPEEVFKDFLRVHLVDPRSTNRHTTDTESFDGTGSTDTFTLSTASTIQCIASVTVDGSEVKKYVDYNYNLRTKQIIFLTNTTSGTDNVVVTYHYGSTDWIFTDEPKIDISSTSYPRIKVWKVDERASRTGTEAGTPASFSGLVQLQIDIWQANFREGFTISSKFYSNEEITKYVARQVVEKLRTEVSDLYPKFHDIVITSSRPWPFDQRRQAFRHTVLIEAQSEVIGQ